MTRSLIYCDCPTCGIEAPLLEVERRVASRDVLEPSENEDLTRAIYGRVPEPDEFPVDVTATCPAGHSLKGALVKALVIERGERQ